MRIMVLINFVMQIFYSCEAYQNRKIVSFQTQMHLNDLNSNADWGFFSASFHLSECF